MSLFTRGDWKYVGEIGLSHLHSGAAYVKGELRAIVSRDPIKVRGVERLRYHLSVSAEKRYPTWDEIKAARYDLLPDELYMAQILPPKGEYVDVHPNTFHLYDIDWEE